MAIKASKTASDAQSSGANTKSRHDQIRDYVLGQITRGIWPTGFKIPTEVELGRQFKASKLTAHHALKSLRDKGYLRRTPGSGTFVAEQSAYVSAYSQMDIGDHVRERGGAYRIEVLNQTLRLASQAEAALFRRDPGVSLLHLRVLHWDDSHPIQIEDRLMLPHLAEGLIEYDFAQESAFAFLMRVRPQRQGRETISARAPSENERVLLQLARDEPCLEIERVIWNESEVVTAVRLIHPGGRFSLSGQIKPQDRV